MRIAVTGANGFLGSHLVERIEAAGHEAVAVVRPTADPRWLAGTRAGAEPFRAVLTDTARLGRALSGCDAVAHLAGATRARPLARFREVNVEGTRAVLEAMRLAAPRPRRLVLTSSLAAIGPSPPDRPLCETDPARPVGAYGASKLEAERVAFAARDDFEVVALRPGPIYGPRDRDMFGVIKAASWGLHLRLGGADRLYNYIHAADAAEVFLLACTRERAAGEVFLVGDRTNYTLRESERIIAAAVGVPPRLVLPVTDPMVRALGILADLFTLPLGRPASLNRDKATILTAGSYAMNTDKARDLLGFEPRLSLAEGMRQTVAWCRDQGWL